MLRLVLLSLAVVCASAMVCQPDICNTVRCAAVTAENCVGEIKKKGGFCGCCDICVTQLAEGDHCFLSLGLLGLPAKSKCGVGLYCDPYTYTCMSDPVQASPREIMSCSDRLYQLRVGEKNGVSLLGRFRPRCDADGSYSARQCHGSGCYCAAPNGEKILDYKAHIGQAANMDCKCARDQYAYMRTGLIGKQFSCTSSGSYRPYACTGSVCYCADESGGMKPGFPTVNIGKLKDLRC